MKKIFISTIIILLICVGCENSNKKEIDKENQNSNSNSNSNSNNNKPVELTKQEEMINKIVDLIDEGLAFDTGNYIAGEVPKGIYAFVKFDGSGSYYSEKDVAGNIIDNENFDSFGYVKIYSVGNLETNGVLVNINAFDKLDVSGAKEIYEILNNLENYNQGGMYKIGNDLPSGTYTLESIGSSYMAILSGPIGDNNIIDNELFNGKYKVTVKNNQYITISHAQIIK